MNIYNLPYLSQDSPKKWENLSHNNCYVITYHNSESSAKCPRCQNRGELIESGLVRALYRCEKCGIFSKLTPKRQSPDGKPIECRLKNPCQGCDGNQGIITAVDKTTGNPHHYRLSCGDCGRFIRWIGEKEFTRKIGKQGGHGNA
jgi:uncharacterized Zn finger protein